MGNIYDVIVLRAQDSMGKTPDGKFIFCPEVITKVSVHRAENIARVIKLLKNGRKPEEVQAMICPFCLGFWDTHSPEMTQEHKEAFCLIEVIEGF